MAQYWTISYRARDIARREDSQDVYRVISKKMWVSSYMIVYLVVLIIKALLVLLFGVNLSSFANLERLIFDCPRSYLSPGTIECMCFVLGKMNTTRLEEITLCISAEDKLECITEMDKSLCMDKFRDLKLFNLALAPDPKVKDWDTNRAMALAKSVFPGVYARGILGLVASRKAELP